MSTRCNIIVREESNMRREVTLYKHNDGHPGVVVPILKDMMKKSYQTFLESGIESWFTNPSKIASMIIHLSVPVVTPEMEKMLTKMDEVSRRFFTDHMLKPIPTIEADHARLGGCDYEFTITLSEKMEDSIQYQYSIEVARVQNGKKAFVIEDLHYTHDGEIISDSEETETEESHNPGAEHHEGADKEQHA